MSLAVEWRRPVEPVHMTGIGEALKALRKERGLTLQVLADKVGTTHASLSEWETGKKTPKRQSIIDLARFYGIPASRLLVLAGLSPEDSEEMVYVRDPETAVIIEFYEGLSPDDQELVARTIKRLREQDRSGTIGGKSNRNAVVSSPGGPAVEEDAV